VGFTATQYALFSSLYSLPGKLIASQSGRIVESAAHSANEGGLFSPLRGLFVSLPAGSLAHGAGEIGVAPASLGAGYFVFFFYSCLIGVVGFVLSLVVVARQTKASADEPALAAASAQFKK
jgi:PAT family beta-lactamase induction signal transducer AmpG